MGISAASDRHARWRVEIEGVELSSILQPLSWAELVRQWKRAEQAAVAAEHDLYVLTQAHVRHGGPPPPVSVRERAEKLRRYANSQKRGLGL
jgi:hypothetical protein